MINRVSAAVEKRDAAKGWIGTRRTGCPRMAEIRDRRALRRDAHKDCRTDEPGCRLRWKQVDVAGSREVRAVDTQIAHRQAGAAACRDFCLQAELLGSGRLEVSVGDINVRWRAGSRRRG